MVSEGILLPCPETEDHEPSSRRHHAVYFQPGTLPCQPPALGQQNHAYKQPSAILERHGSHNKPIAVLINRVNVNSEA